MNIILCGFKNAGKTTLGSALSAAIHYSFIDTDYLLVNRQEKSVPDIYAEFGETRFRQLEHTILMTLTDVKNTVIATGGGTFVNPKSARLLKELGKIIYLQLDEGILYQRMLENRLPRFIEEGYQQFSTFYKKRHAIYQDYAEEILDAKHKTTSDLLGIITQGIIKNGQ